VLLGFLLVLTMLALAACNRNQQGTQTAELLSSYLPDDWKQVTEGENVTGFQQVNIDGDEAVEWLYFFHYDNQNDGTTLGPIGGIIYDAQQDVDIQQPAAFFVPYRLLPDWREGKGQGYLGETSVSWAPAYLNARDEGSSAIELTVLGYSAGDLLTRLSLFRWQGMDPGYDVSNFVGNGGLLLTPEIDNGATAVDLITEVVAFNRLNDRSRLCEQIQYKRVDTENRFVAGPPAIVFCPLTNAEPGVPDQPTYPEAVVMAWLLGGQRDDLALDNAALKAVMTDSLQRVVHVQYPGAATLVNRGDFVSEMTVQTVLETSAGRQTIQWLLVELRPTAEEKTSRWRIASAQRIE
jgi:hypothetical protein